METKNKIYIITVFFGLIILSLIVFFIFPSFKKIKSNSDDLFSKKQSISILKNQADQVENFKKKYNEYKPNLEKTDQLFIDLENPVNFIKFLEKTASDSGIESEISLSPYSLKENESSITFQFFSSGNFLKILEFTKAMESGPYLVEIKNLIIKNSEVKNASKNNLSEIVDATFLIKAFSKLQ